MSSSTPSIDESRIEILDGFRFIAVTAVVFFHYFYWFSNFDPFTNFPRHRIFMYGFFGVQVFFMISGFVIYRSMEQSMSLSQFLGKRYLRLAPSLILCSIISYVMIKYWNQSESLEMFRVNSSSPLSFLFSFTFIHPDIWNLLLGHTDIKYIDGAYWLLWPEIVFYISASITFFNSSKENFLRNWFGFVLVANILRLLLEFTAPKISFLLLSVGMVAINQFIYFSLGILFYSVWMRRTIPREVWVMLAILLTCEMYLIEDRIVRVLVVLAIGGWIAFLRRPRWFLFLTWRPFQLIGLISYPLYLIHEVAGLALVDKLITWTNHRVPVWVLMTIVLAVMISMAYLIYSIFEKKITRTLKAQLLGIK